CSCLFFFFFSSRRRHTRWPRDWSSDVCSSDLPHRGHRRDGGPGAGVGEADIQPGRGAGLGLPLREREQIGGGGTTTSHRGANREIGRASCRERVEIAGGAV